MRLDLFRTVRSPKLRVWARRQHVATGLLGAAAVGLAVAAALVGSLLLRPAVSALPSPHMTEMSSLSSAASASRSPGGIPTSLDGEPVYLGLGAVLHADAMKDATPFLVGGWFGDGTRDTCTGGGLVLGTPDPALFRHGCGSVVGGDSPWGRQLLARTTGVAGLERALASRRRRPLDRSGAYARSALCAMQRRVKGKL
jgi:hypothetical protein